MFVTSVASESVAHIVFGTKLDMRQTSVTRARLYMTTLVASFQARRLSDSVEPESTRAKRGSLTRDEVCVRTRLRAIDTGFALNVARISPVQKTVPLTNPGAFCIREGLLPE